MEAKTIQYKHTKTKYYLTNVELENVLYKLNEMDVTPSKYANSIGVDKGSFWRVLKGERPLTKKMYVRAFKELDCIKNLPKEFND